MERIKKLLARFTRDDEGASATEYAVLIVLIIVVALTAITLLGNQVERGFNNVATAIETAADNAGAGT